MLAVVAARLMSQTLTFPPGAAGVASYSSFRRPSVATFALRRSDIDGVLIAPPAPLQLAPSVIDNADARLALRESGRFSIAGVSCRAHLERRFFKDNPFFFFFC